MILLNFSHPLTPAQQRSVATLSGQTIERVIDVKTHFDHAQPFVAQTQRLLEAIDLSPEQWQTAPLLLNLPSLNVIAALVLAEIHGRCGYFPAVLRLKPVADTTPPLFAVSEILNIQMVWEAARQRR